jgi:mannose-6-phosphate isomerase-like protein (cupin superfamily)
MGEPTFRDFFSGTENEVFKIVSFVDRIYHRRYLNAAVSPRYRYNVRVVQTKSDIVVLLAEVFLDSQFFCNVLRLEYRSARLVEAARVHGRVLGEQIEGWFRLIPQGQGLETPPQQQGAAATVKLTFDEAIKAYQVEVWETLEAAPTCTHDIKVLDQMGRHRPITARNELKAALHDLTALRGIEVAFREDDHDFRTGLQIDEPEWDNNYGRSYQVPRSPEPDSPENNEFLRNYYIPFLKSLYLDAARTPPIRYRNALMDESNPERRPDNILDIRWLLQRQLGGRGIYFQEVTVPPGAVEGVHLYVGAEALYYVIEGEGVAYLGEHDDPATASFPTVQRDVLGVGLRPCKAVPLRPGNTVYARSGAMQGFANPGNQPLRLVRFGFHPE